NLRLEGPLHEPILDFRYDDRWYPSTDGAGFALQIVSDNLLTTSWGLKSSWRPSGAFQGTPGTADPGAPPIPVIYINEALTHTIPPDVDAIELYNPNGVPVNVGGWFLTDDFGTPKKYRLPNPTTIPANGYLVLHADTSFGSAFLLSSMGDELYLFSGDANTNLTGYVHGFDFGPQATNGTFGRYVTSTGEDHFPTQKFPTLGSANAGPKVGPIVISEINYHPPDLLTVEGPRDNQKDEYIELENVTDSNQPLYDPANPANTWRLRDAVSFSFPTGLVMPPGGHVLIVAFDPVLDPAAADAFRARNGAFQGAPLLGPYSGQLDNSSASVELVRPAAPQPAGAVDEILVDKVRYANTEPWPLQADGLGLSLQRRMPTAYGNDPTNWVADIKTPGYVYGGGNGPVITVQPQSISVLGTRMAQFSVTATGAPPIFYLWYFGNFGILGATNSIYTIPSVQPAHVGQYRCLVQNAGGANISSTATLTYITPLEFVSHPTNVILRIPPDPLALTNNRHAYFRVATTTAHPPLSYQWLKNGTNIPAALNPTAVSNLMTISNVVLLDEGVYNCAATDGAGTVFSASATLTPWIEPRFLVPPVPNQTNPVATAFTVSSVLTGHPPPYTIFYRSNSMLVGRTDVSNHASFFTFPGNFASSLVTSNWYRLVLSNVASHGLGVSVTMTNHTRADFDMDGLPDYFEV
ncbi:MAG TPA: lamin tail domain-containing protein, partial [Verrucomicrobiae bacterium]|nr:lamin tail domain-containing protein [Verrucomicrobiae bacterium]